MKKFRVFTASILASAMAMSMATGFAAFAAPTIANPGNITESNSVYTVSVIKTAGDKAAHKYEAYQIFTADTEDDSLKITGWGAGVDPVALVNAIKADTFEYHEEFASVAELDGDSDEDVLKEAAEKVAAVLETFGHDEAEINAFAKAVAGCLGTPKTQAGTENTAYTDIQVGSAGYYLIKDSDDSVKGEHSAMTRYILTPTNTINPVAKADFPTIDKKILEDNVEKEANTVSIGDTVTYKLESKVPNMTGYNKYFYIVNDSMFKGLTLDEDSFTITIDGTELEEDAFYINHDPDPTFADGTNDFEIVFVNFLQYKEQEGDKIVITYNAELNEDAKIGKEGNPNTVDLTFSNDPNHKYEGTPEDPDTEEPEKPDEPKPDKPGEPGDPMGKTPDHKVITYTAGIELTKVDSADENKTLAGAEFTITGDGVKTVVTYETVFEEDEEGEYYLLKDGTYTTTDPTGAEDKYESTDIKYTKKDELNKVTEENAANVNLAVDNDGVLRIYGLGDGTYTITETKAPTGYISTGKSETVTIESAPTLTGCTWKFNDEADTTGTGIYKLMVKNPKGVVLPGTGAFGSKLMYALGTIFTATGAAYMISKKSKKEEE